MSASGTRLDAFVSDAISDLSRARVGTLVESGDILVDGTKQKRSFRLRGAEVITATVPPPRQSELTAEDIPLDVLYEDDDLIVVNKPSGLVVHPGAGNPTGTLVHALLHHVPSMSIGDTERPGIVHRLDRGTSGAIVCAKNNRAQVFLSNAFAEREVKKTYIAFTFGIPKTSKFELITGHRRHPRDRMRFTTKDDPPGSETAPNNVRLAHSKFSITRSARGIAEIEVDLLTGRTHQIRAHLSDIGHALIGDNLTRW